MSLIETLAADAENLVEQTFPETKHLPALFAALLHRLEGAVPSIVQDVLAPAAPGQSVEHTPQAVSEAPAPISGPAAAGAQPASEQPQPQQPAAADAAKAEAPPAQVGADLPPAVASEPSTQPVAPEQVQLQATDATAAGSTPPAVSEPTDAELREQLSTQTSELDKLRAQLREHGIEPE